MSRPLTVALAVLAALLVLGGVVNLAAGQLTALSPIVIGLALLPGAALISRRRRYRSLNARADAEHGALGV